MAEFFGQVDQQMHALHARLDAFLTQQQSRGADLSWGLEGTNPLGHQQVEGFYGAMNGMQDDRLEYAHDYGLDQLHDRLDEMQQARPQEQSRAHGMGY
jgi:hypothetical protein